MRRLCALIGKEYAEGGFSGLRQQKVWDLKIKRLDPLACSD